MSKLFAIGIGLVINIPVFIFIFFTFIFPGFIPELNNPKEGIDLMRLAKHYSFFVSIGGVIFCTIYLLATSYVPKGKKILWIVILFIANILAIPFFWYFYIWRSVSNITMEGDL